VEQLADMTDTTLNFVEGEGISIQTGPNPGDPDTVDVEIASTLVIPDTPAGGGDPADDTAVWMPLTTTLAGDDVLVFDADHSLIPTLTPLG
jgi:hypothetical protein